MIRSPAKTMLALLACWVLALAGQPFARGCGTQAPGPPDEIITGVNLTTLFAPPTPAERPAVLAGWRARRPEARQVQVETTMPVQLGARKATLTVVSHRVAAPGAAPPVTHYGAIIVPRGAPPGSLPLLVYAHPGDAGVDVAEVLERIQHLLGKAQDRFAYAVPSFRSETLRFDANDDGDTDDAGEFAFRSTGAPSPWNYDVDDALALVDAALERFVAIDEQRIGVLGFSRGAAVGLLMSIRDGFIRDIDIDAVVAFYGPTDFFGPFARHITRRLLKGTAGLLLRLPGVRYLNQTVVQPLKEGDISTEQARRALLRRSPIYFARRLPALQIHHGAEDHIVPVQQARRLISRMVVLGRGPQAAPVFEGYIYAEGGHHPATLEGSYERAAAFLEQLLVGPQTAVPTFHGADHCHRHCHARADLKHPTGQRV